MFKTNVPSINYLKVKRRVDNPGSLSVTLIAQHRVDSHFLASFYWDSVPRRAAPIFLSMWRELTSAVRVPTFVSSTANSSFLGLLLVSKSPFVGANPPFSNTAMIFEQGACPQVARYVRGLYVVRFDSETTGTAEGGGETVGG